MNTYLDAGTPVRVRPFMRKQKGGGLIYGEFTGTLLDDCNGEGWDVVDIELPNGDAKSAYSFSVERAPRTACDETLHYRCEG